MLSAGRITGLNPITWSHDSNGSANGVEQHDVHAQHHQSAMQD